MNFIPMGNQESEAEVSGFKFSSISVIFNRHMFLNIFKRIPPIILDWLELSICGILTTCQQRGEGNLFNHVCLSVCLCTGVFPQYRTPALVFPVQCPLYKPSRNIQTCSSCKLDLAVQDLSHDILQTCSLCSYVERQTVGMWLECLLLEPNFMAFQNLCGNANRCRGTCLDVYFSSFVSNICVQSPSKTFSKCIPMIDPQK